MIIVKVLTTDGTWWTLARKLTKDRETFEKVWSIARPDDLIETSDENTYIQIRNIVAVTLEKNEYDMSMLGERNKNE